MENFPSNSSVPKPEPKEEKKILRVVEGEVKRRKKPLSARFMETFFTGASTQSVIDYVVKDILIPAAKDMIVDAFNQGLEKKMYGEVRSSTRRTVSNRPSGNGGYINYNRVNSSSPFGKRDDTRQISRRARATHNFDEIILNSRAEGDEVIEEMYRLLEKYDSVSVSDLYDLVGIEWNHVDEKWGWDANGNGLRGSSVRRLGQGSYLLDLPPTEPID